MCTRDSIVANTMLFNLMNENKDKIANINEKCEQELTDVIYFNAVKREEDMSQYYIKTGNLSIEQRKLTSYLHGYSDYAKKMHYNTGLIEINHPLYIEKTKRKLNLDVYIKYGLKLKNIEYDGIDHMKKRYKIQINENSKEFSDEERDKMLIDLGYSVSRFMVHGVGELKTSKCYEVSKSFTRKDAIKLFSDLNEFYGLYFDENCVLDYIKSNPIYKAKNFLAPKERTNMFVDRVLNNPFEHLSTASVLLEFYRKNIR